MRMGNKPDGVTAARSPALPAGLSAIIRPAPAALPIPVRRAKKPAAARRGSSLLYLVVAAGLALAASAAVLNRTWPKVLAFGPKAAPVVATKPGLAAQNKAGQVIIPRINTDLCDRYTFDNVSGQMKRGETSPCSAAKKKPDVDIADQVNSFHSSWRGRGVAPSPDAPGGR